MQHVMRASPVKFRIGSTHNNRFAGQDNATIEISKFCVQRIQSLKIQDKIIKTPEWYGIGSFGG